MLSLSVYEMIDAYNSAFYLILLYCKLFSNLEFNRVFGH